jgi:hypothetical protein
MKTWESGGIAPPLVISGIDGGEWSASCPCHFTIGERARSTHCIGLLGSRAGLDTMESRKILQCWEFDPGSRPCSLSPIPAPNSLSYPDCYLEMAPSLKYSFIN